MSEAPGVHELRAARQLVAARPLEGPLRLQEVRIDAQRALEVEGAQIQHLRQRQLRVARAHQPCAAIDGAQLLLDARQLGGADQVGLVEQQHVGKADLVGGDGHRSRAGR